MKKILLKIIINKKMKKFLESVEKFHKTFKVGESPETYEVTSPEEYTLRHNLMKEENEEYLEACKNHDLVEIADALGDQLYILCGTILKHGLGHKIEQVFNEIQDSNMSKLDVNGEPILREDGKILKGENYFKPNIEKILIPDGLYFVKVGGKYIGRSEEPCGWGLVDNKEQFAAGFQTHNQASEMVEVVSGKYDKELIHIEKQSF